MANSLWIECLSDLTGVMSTSKESFGNLNLEWKISNVVLGRVLKVVHALVAKECSLGTSRNPLDFQNVPSTGPHHCTEILEQSYMSELRALLFRTFQWNCCWAYPIQLERSYSSNYWDSLLLVHPEPIHCRCGYSSPTLGVMLFCVLF